MAMDADPAATNHIDKLEHSPPHKLTTQFPLLFEKLLDPNQEPRVIYSYVVRPIHQCLNPPPALNMPGRLVRYSQGFLP